MKENKMKFKKAISFALILILVPLTVFLGFKFAERQYYIVSLLIIIYTTAAFFIMFEKKRPQARELVLLAIMCAIAIASRAAFIWLPQFKPMAAIIMIAGAAFGAQAGFLCGAVSALVSNFIFGQGAWTPWQMFAFGMAGFLAGLFFYKGRVRQPKRMIFSVFGAVIVLAIVGPILDTSSLFMMATEVNAQSAAAIYLSGLPFNAIHAAATFVTLILFSKPMLEKLERIRIKYAMGEENAL